MQTYNCKKNVCRRSSHSFAFACVSDLKGVSEMEGGEGGGIETSAIDPK